MSAQDDIISTDPDVMGGCPVFRGTRVPVSTLGDYLITGSTLDEFLEDFPTVSREQAQSLLERALQETVRSHASAA